jgi:hypothetical protein
VVLALIGVLVADFFISQMYSKLLWTLLALGPAMYALARHEARRDSEPDDPRDGAPSRAGSVRGEPPPLRLVRAV